MSRFNLNDAAKARATLARLRALMSDPANAETWAKGDKAKALLKEAEALIEGLGPAAGAATRGSEGPPTPATRPAP